MRWKNTSPAQLDGMVNDFCWKALKIELVGRIEAVPRCSHSAGLDTISPDDLTVSSVVDGEVVTSQVVLVVIKTGRKRSVEPFAQLEVEDLETETKDLIELTARVDKAGEIATIANLTLRHIRSEGRISVIAIGKGLSPIEQHVVQPDSDDP